MAPMSVIGPVSAEVVVPAAQQFEAIRKDHTRICEAVAEQIQRRVMEDLGPGDALPPERELVRMFRVSRSSVREAIRKLEWMGLVEIRQGSRTVVCKPSAKALSVPLTRILLQKREVLAELLDFRKMLEPALARRAAVHVSRNSLPTWSKSCDVRRQDCNRAKLRSMKTRNSMLTLPWQRRMEWF